MVECKKYIKTISKIISFIVRHYAIPHQKSARFIHIEAIFWVKIVYRQNIQ